MPQPKLLSKPWASDGLKNNIPAERNSELAQEAATYAEGFPSITMTPISVGGKPPSGKDMNGVLYEISAHTVWQNQGGRYRFDQSFCDAIGGYPKGAVLINDTLDTEYISLVDANTHNPNSGNNTGKWAVLSGKALNERFANYLPLTGGTINGSLTIQAANAKSAGIRINNTDTTAIGSVLGLDVGGLTRGGLEIFSEGEGSYSVALTATAKGDSSDRHERVLSAATGYVWTRAYGNLHDYFARKTDLTNQIDNLRNEINNKFTHSNYPNHYAGAEVWRLLNGLKITIMRIDGINASGDYNLPEAYQGRAIAIANDIGEGRRVVSSYLHPNSNRVTVFVNNLNVSVNIIAIGWANH